MRIGRYLVLLGISAFLPFFSAGAVAQDKPALVINPYPRGEEGTFLGLSRPQGGPEEGLISILKRSPAIDMVEIPPSPSQAFPETTLWRAPRGAGMEQVLAAWAREAGVDLVWDTADEFSVLSEVNVEGGFAEAVEALLAQYANESNKPAGRLHVGQEGGATVLVIQSSGNPDS